VADRVVPDETWAQVARDSRDALALLGFPITGRCLPDEAEPCGATWAQHAAAQLATLRAVVDHQLEHVGLPGVAGEVYRHEAAELEAECWQAHPLVRRLIDE
jgi:hypothetical protein